MRYALSLLLLVQAPACFSPAPDGSTMRAQQYRDNMPPDDQARFRRCAFSISTAQCGADSTPQFRDVCTRQLAEQMMQLPDTPSRKRWLVQNGCPRDMVD